MTDSVTPEDQTKEIGPAGHWRYTDAEHDRRWLERLRKRTAFAENGCWVWQGPVGTKGYICLLHRKWRGGGHRVVYRLLINANLRTEDFVCHRCDNRRCWNPAHLFVGSARVNNRDCGNKGRHHNGVKTHCKRGHEFTPENTYLKVTPTTVMRSCLECQKIRANSPRYKEKVRESARRRRALKRSRVSI